MDDHLTIKTTRIRVLKTFAHAVFIPVGKGRNSNCCPEKKGNSLLSVNQAKEIVTNSVTAQSRWCMKIDMKLLTGKKKM